ncbi:MAG: hypothetical protein WA156_07690 [Methylocystis silviterrae]
MEQVREVAGLLDAGVVERLAQELSQLREREGRLFILGVGGSAGNCGHAANDFRKLCGIETYAPTDNVSELTARANDEGWDTIFTGWLEVSRLSSGDAILVFSVGGGNVACVLLAAALIRAIGAQHSDARCLDRAADFEPSALPPMVGPLSFEPKRPRRKGAGSSFVDWEPLAPVKN